MTKVRYPWKEGLDRGSCCNSETQLKIENLSLSYGKKLAFYGIDMEINRGCVTGIIGPSGSGKSSFLNCLNRMVDLVEEVKLEGDIYLDDKSIFDLNVNLIELRKKIGIVFQEPTPLPLSIYDNIELPLREHGYSQIRERVERVLRQVGLWEEVRNDLSSPAMRLSGGQKQRLCLARTMALEPDIILMDEPCSSLDPISTEKIESLIDFLRGKYTILIVTHNLAQARRVCDYLHVFWYSENLTCGELIESGTCAQVFERPKSQTVREYVSGFRG